jgi:hypothetical protein
MMKLEAVNVNNIFLACLFNDDEASNAELVKANVVEVEGIIARYGLHRARVEQNAENIKSMLGQLPVEFINNGYTFLNMPFNTEGEQWGEQRTAEQLYVLGAALGLAEFCLPREAWRLMPGGVPYINVKL